MSRPLRIEYPDAWYHVMNRGRRREKIFSCIKDYTLFIGLLKESCFMWHVRIGAFCLMPNHYHILIQTPDGNISRCMRHINGVYTQRFNRVHGCDGPLFRGRYKSILVEAETYLLELLRYIHRNPLKAGLAERLDAYQWSSHKGYMSKAKKWDWLHKDFIFSMLSSDKKDQRRKYREFVSKVDSEEIERIFKGKKLPSLIGSARFIDWIKEKYFNHKGHSEVPESKILAPDKEIIKGLVCERYGIGEDELYKSKRGVFNEPRNVAVYLIRVLRCEGLEEIGRDFDMTRYSSVSSVIERVKNQILKDRKFKKRLDAFRAELTKGQTKT